MLTPITCFTLICDTCHQPARDDETGGVYHLESDAEAREWFSRDTNTESGDEPGPWWDFRADATHQCPDCQCTAHGHLLDTEDDGTPAQVLAACRRCRRWLDLRPRLFRLAAHFRDRRWLSSPAGCCTCGTGGPYYDGTAPQVTRYLYGDATAGSDGTRCDWSSCSRHRLSGRTPVVDYGRDVVVTQAQTDHDFAAALTRPAIAR